MNRDFKALLKLVNAEEVRYWPSVDVPFHSIPTGVPPVMIDILLNVAGIEFNPAWRHHVEAVVDAEAGLTANFMSARDLMTAKLASARAQDIADAEALQSAVNAETRGRLQS